MNHILNILFICTTTIGIVLTVHFYLKSRTLHKERFRYSWSDIAQGIQGIINDLKKASFKPDIILSISGSGGIVGNLAMIMFDEHLPFYQVMLEDPSNPWEIVPYAHTTFISTRWKIHIPDSILEEDIAKKIWIIDDTCVTGTTGGAMAEFLKSNGFKDVKWTCLLRVKPVTQLLNKPDIYYFDSPTTEFYYPWGKAK